MSARRLLCLGVVVVLMCPTTGCLTLMTLGAATPFEEPVDPLYTQMWGAGLAAEIVMISVFVADVGVTLLILLPGHDWGGAEPKPASPNRESADPPDPSGRD